jgi:hypothetical protein
LREEAFDQSVTAITTRSKRHRRLRPSGGPLDGVPKWTQNLRAVE